MSNFKIELGSKVKSDIRGFTGIVTARSENLNGCNRYSVDPPVDKEGKLMDGYWFDEQELIVIHGPKIKRIKVDTGGAPSKFR